LNFLLEPGRGGRDPKLTTAADLNRCSPNPCLANAGDVGRRMRGESVTFNGRIPDRRYARGLCTNPNGVRLRANRNRPDVANVDIVSATIVQIRSCEKTQSDVLISLAAVQCSSSESSIEVDGTAIGQTG